MRKRRLVGASLGGAALTMVFAATAFACTIFVGEFTVKGDQGGEVTGIGSGLTMSNVIQGDTSALTNGELVVSTAAAGGQCSADTNVRSFNCLPASDGESWSYDINVFDGDHAYNTDLVTTQELFLSHNGDCMSDGGSEIKIGEVDVATDGRLVGGPQNFDLTDSDGIQESSQASFFEPIGGGEGAVCISDPNATYGNQVPVTFL